MKKRSVILAGVLAAVILLAGTAWILAKAPFSSSEENLVTLERILAANHPSTLLRSGDRFLVTVDGVESGEYYLEDGFVLKRDAGGKNALVVDREYVVREEGEDYVTEAIKDSEFQGSWYADLVLNTALTLKEEIKDITEKDGELIVTTSLSGEDYDSFYGRKTRDTASCSTVYTLDSATCRVKSAVQTAVQKDGSTLNRTVTLTVANSVPPAFTALTANAANKTTPDETEYRLDTNGDGQINILFIGNSYSYYWTDELWTLLNAAGYGNPQKDGSNTALHVSNLYLSGADFDTHWQWYEQGMNYYNYYTVYNEGSDKNPLDPKTRINVRCSMVATLVAKEWDVISFQQGNDLLTSENRYREQINAYFPLLFDLVSSYHPNAQFYWQQNWSHEIGDGTNKSYKSMTNVNLSTRVAREVGQEVCREYGLNHAPLGDAWEIVRHDPDLFGFPAGGGAGKTCPLYSLHSRVIHGSTGYGTITLKDLSHDGDAGGGQYLNGCTWFEVLTRTRLEETAAKDFIPNYDCGEDSDKANGSYYVGMRNEKGEYIRYNAEEFKEIESEAKAVLAKLRKASHKAVVASYGEEYFLAK